MTLWIAGTICVVLCVAMGYAFYSLFAPVVKEQDEAKAYYAYKRKQRELPTAEPCPACGELLVRRDGDGQLVKADR